jgi:hypothetical protein
VKVNLDYDLDQLKIFESRILVKYASESFLVDIGRKKNYYIFDNLKEDACNFWQIPTETRDRYYIVNSKLQIYCPNLLVWDIHKIALQNNNKSNLAYMHMELLDRVSIVMEKNTNYKAKEAIQAIIPVEQSTNNNDVSVILGSEIFQSELEDYVQLYRRKEAILNICKRKKKAKINLPDIVLEEAKEDEIEEDKKERERRFQDQVEKRKKEIDEIRRKEAKKPEDPIYLSMFDIFKYRLLKFWDCFFSIIFAFSIYCYLYYDGKLSLNAEYQMSEVLYNDIIFPSVYKNLLRKTKEYENKDLSGLISSKKDLLVYLDIIFNNLIFDKGDYKSKDTSFDIYNGFFQRQNIPYQIYYALRIGFKTNNKLVKVDNFINLGKNIEDKLTYYHEYQQKEEDNSPKTLIISKTSLNILRKYEDLICDACFTRKKLLYVKNFNDTSALLEYSTGEYGSYEGGSFFFDINPNLVDRKTFNELLSVVKDILINNPYCRMMYINMNIISVYYKAIERFQLLFEFSILGTVQSTLKEYLLDFLLNKNFYIKAIYYSTMVQVAIFMISLLFRFLSKCLVSPKVKIGSFYMLYDAVIIGLFFYCVYLNGLYEELISQTLGDSMTTPVNIKKDPFNPKYWKYFELSPIMEIDNLYDRVYAFMVMLTFLRTLFFFMASPLIRFIANLLLTTTKNIFNIFVILLVFILSLMLIFHISLGIEIREFTDLNTTLLIAFSSILGSLNNKIKNLTSIEYVIIIILLILIKFILFTFIFAIIKDTFDTLNKEFRNYRKRDHYKLVRESVILFLKYLMLPFSFYFMIQDYRYFSGIFAGKNLEKIVLEGGESKGIYNY